MFRTLRITLALAAAAAAAAEGLAYAQEAPEAVEPPAPKVDVVAAPLRFDPGNMPEAKLLTPPLGYRHGDLTMPEIASLRRSFKLPLDALATATSTYDLSQAAVVAPLPDPHRPLLSVLGTADSTANPFADTRTTSFRADPLKAFGEMLGAVEGEERGSDKTVDEPSDDPFGGAAVAPTEAVAPSESAEVADDTDPFGDSGDPFGDDAPAEAPSDEAADPAETDEDPFSF